VEQVTWRENVSSTHYAHSFVRGNWASEARSAPMILAKCCHDLDQIGWVTGQRVSALASFGRLTHFRPVHAPAGAPERCTDGCPAAETCPYFAPDIYLTADAGWPASVISLDHSLAARREALETGPYGRCVYRCDNDVVDTQVLAFEFEGGATGTLTMHGFSSEEGRTLRLDGTRGSLMARFATRQEIRFEPHDPFTSFHGGGEVVWTPEDEQDGRHGGGDGALCRAFVAAVRAGRPESVDDFLESHWLAFAAETSRQTGQVVPMDRFRRGLVAR
ncbi:MAG TPA: Gfo/Idh/MocA family oxidoreductase, partial [Deinococcales bacterium]|nr:Gfo/Idh/MocA family oxidoreductase [Deinococcales bacterium]